MWTSWLVFAGVILLIELAHPRWILIWFAIGAAASSLLAVIFPSAFAPQLFAFLAISLGLMAAARPIVYHLLFKQHPHRATNIAAVIGRQEICLSDVDNLQGRGTIRVYGSVWHAVSHQDDVKIKAGERVRVVGIRDLDLIVEPLDQTARVQSTSAVSDEVT